jgi:hypothetical protein
VGGVEVGLGECGWQLPDEVYHFAGVGVALGARLGIDFSAVNGDFESALFTSDEGYSVETVTELLDDLRRQTDGSWPIVSFLAIEDLYLHVARPLSYD